jgi:hypothetical protein
MTRRTNEAYLSFSTERRRRFGVNLALTLDRPVGTPVPNGWSAMRAVIRLRRDDAAASAVFRQAEELAPEEVHYSVAVREALREMLKREHRYATPELRRSRGEPGIISS